ncbi:glycosyltransferase family 2 protein [Mucisphaera calidilacus]|uniref:PGL p-HBAD biosynthesis glycosyltransferase n=1 Tax=Mucisphaera calidilacus TaxID=2527982 RepID=A0A518BUX9_9BACT|nr:glycosyltransferase family 2 protein [Mucisphaera calidilacus]QDU70792.1 PGL p-HBAD biosynthesis glycosyltransferase [Mucisphaera calidilacus]
MLPESCQPGPIHDDPPGIERARPCSLAVVIPSYNRAEYLRDAIDSVLAQDHPDLSLLVMDGGSTDGSIEILRSYGDRVAWVSEPDEGHADAINKGWERTRSEVIAWLNADDCFASPRAARLACQYLAASPETDIVYGDCHWIDERGDDRGIAYAQPFSLSFAVVTADHCIPQPASFIRRSVVERVGALSLDVFAKDREFWLRAGLHGRIDYWPRHLADQRNDEGISYLGRRVAPAIVEVTRSFYRLQGVPEDLLRLKPRAMSNAHLRAAYYAWAGGRQWDLYLWHLLCALASDARNLPRIRWHFRRYVGESLGIRKPQRPIPA